MRHIAESACLFGVEHGHFSTGPVGISCDTHGQRIARAQQRHQHRIGMVEKAIDGHGHGERPGAHGTSGLLVLVLQHKQQIPQSSLLQ